MAKKRSLVPTVTKPGIFIGKHPDTGVIHRLTIQSNGKILIERQPYVSTLDGWTKHYEDLYCEASKHEYLILKIKNNPCDWHG